MRNQLLRSMPKELLALVSENPITVDVMHHMFANRTAARFSDLDEIVLRLFKEKEFDILDPDGKRRSRNLKRLRPTDRIVLLRYCYFPAYRACANFGQQMLGP